MLKIDFLVTHAKVSDNQIKNICLLRVSSHFNRPLIVEIGV